MRLSKGVVATVVASLSGCVLITGSTDGYQLVDAGACLSAADCVSDAGPRVCCINVTGASVGGPTCGPPPCSGSPTVQLCTMDTECSGTSCALQKCAFGGMTASIQACGMIVGCSAP